MRTVTLSRGRTEYLAGEVTCEVPDDLADEDVEDYVEELLDSGDANFNYKCVDAEEFWI
jgi:hypothetical protein